MGGHAPLVIALRQFIMCLGLLLAVPSMVPGQERTYFGFIVSEELFGTGTDKTAANPFPGYYEKGRFVDPTKEGSWDSCSNYKPQLESLTKPFPLGQPLPGMSEQGSVVEVVIESVLSPKLDEPWQTNSSWFKVRVRGKAGTRPVGTVLFWTPNEGARAGAVWQVAGDS